MCGIAGILVADRLGGVDADELLAMRETMRRRGPDGAGLWVAPDGRTGLAHRRLAVIDPRPEADQPMEDRPGSCRIVFNGEILNYRELRAELAQHGHDFRTSSDTEVLLHLYERYGPDMLGRLRGMFAFAIWDEERRRLFAARDPFGIVPFYYADDRGAFRFASQVKALKAGGIALSPDPAGRVGFFLFGYVPEPFTSYREIRALPPGHCLTVESGAGVRIARYFNIAAEVAAARATPAPPDADARRGMLHDALLDSVRANLVADVPVGIFLSAGIDSGALLSLATESAGPGLDTVTLGFPDHRGSECDETDLAAASAARFGARHHTRWIEASEFEAEHDALLAAMDQPSIDGVNTYFVSKAAAETGLKVALSGLGGDELFGGYPSFRQIPTIVHGLRRLAGAPWLGRAFRTVSAPLLRHLTSPKYAGLLEYGTRYSGAYLLRRGLYMPWELPGLLDAELVRAGWRALEPLARLDATIEGIEGDRLLVMTLELCWYLCGQLLRDTDWAGLAHSVEIRPPLVDVDLFRRLLPVLVSPMPPAKADMADCLRTPLPAAVRERRKTGFAVPVRDWLMRKTGETGRGLRGWARHVYREIERRA